MNAHHPPLGRGHATPRRVPAPHTRTVQTPQATVLVDYRTGGIALLTGTPQKVWQTHLAGQDIPSTAPNRVPAGNATPDVTEQVVRDLANRGWLAATSPQHHPWPVIHVDQPAVSWGTQEVPAQLRPVGYAPLGWRIAALAAVMVTLAVRQTGRPSRRFARMVCLAHAGRRLPVATTDQARNAVRAVRWAARLVPARVACLEESVAATLLLAFAGARAKWCHGVAADPLRFHAWITGPDGEPVEEPADTENYTPIVQIPG